MNVKLREWVPLDQLVVGSAYELASRNLHTGIWDGRDFHGIRTKFGDKFMDSETHYDLDEHHGTAVAVKLLS